MKTKNVIFAVLILFVGNVLFAQKAVVDTKLSSVEWLGKKITGQHEGTIQLKSGSFELKDDQIVKGNFVIDMTTIVNTDLKDETYNKKLVNHLKSDDFFGAEKFPTAEFTVTQSSKFKNGKAAVKGNLTIKGKTEVISFFVERSDNHYSAKFDVDRTKFDVKYGSDTFFDNLGDKTIDDLFTLTVNIVVF